MNTWIVVCRGIYRKECSKKVSHHNTQMFVIWKLAGVYTHTTEEEQQQQKSFFKRASHLHLSSHHVVSENLLYVVIPCCFPNSWPNTQVRNSRHRLSMLKEKERKREKKREPHTASWIPSPFLFVTTLTTLLAKIISIFMLNQLFAYANYPLDEM